jgi:hypothetical protein
MSAPEGAAGLQIGALDLFVQVLSQSEAGSTADGFYDHLCEAVCRLASMRRAVIFRYDSADRRVRATGAHGMSVAPFANAHVTIDSAPIAAQALREDRVVEVVGDLLGEAPDEFASIVAEPARLVCAPMAAGGRMIGVILADRPMSEPSLRDADRQLLWTLGKAAALASVARSVSTQFERASALEQRIDLAREIHDDVIQRLFGVSMALDGDGDLPFEARARSRPRARSGTCAARCSGRWAVCPERPGRPCGPRWRDWRGRTLNWGSWCPRMPGLTMISQMRSRRRWSRWPSRCSSRRSATRPSTPRRPV